MINIKQIQKFGQVVQKIEPEGKLTGTWGLKGGVSAQVTALEFIQANGRMKRVIIRQHGSTTLKRNPHVTSDEYKLLEILKSEGLPVPTPYYLDQSGEIFPTPYIIIEYIEGTTEFSSVHLLQLVTHLARIHSLDVLKLNLSFLPKLEEKYTEKLNKIPIHLDESLDEGVIRDTLKSVWPLPKRNKDVLLHGDFWPGNILWKEDILAAIIDWEDAAFGDPLADVANSRLEILWAFGMDAMNEFTNQYKSLMPTIDFTNLPYWDLCAALRPASNISNWGLDAATEKKMRERHKLFLKQALDTINR